MGAFKLELRCTPHKAPGDPEPDWSFEGLLSEINSLEKELNASSTTPVYLPKTHSRMGSERRGIAFVMSIDDDEFASSGSGSEGDEEERDYSLVVARRFGDDNLYLSESDDSENELVIDDTPYFLEEGGLEEGALFELQHDQQLGFKEEIQNQISLLETALVADNQDFASAFAEIEKYIVARREADKKLDVQYRRKVAEALDNHITAIQRDHELKSQLEERRIRNDAAHEEAKRREKALQEERQRQERARAEAEAKAKADEAEKSRQKKDEAEKQAALAAERKAAKEAGEREANDASKRLTAPVSREEAAVPESGSSDIVRATESALKAEQERIQKLKKLQEENNSLISSSNMGFSVHQRHIVRLIKQISGVQQNVSGKADDILKIMRNPSCPQSISIATFAEKVVSNCRSPNNAPFPTAHVIVLVASQVPQVLQFVLAELHRACIYTVPKHIVYSESVFESREAYYKTIGYEDNGKIESVQSYLDRLKSYMMLYGALVQTEEAQGMRNSHGPREGWAWLARFLNRLPANRYTAVALNAFLQAAGFVLFRNYKSQFIKVLNVIKDDFLKALRERKDSELNPIITEIQSYVEDAKFRKEPEGRRLQGSLLSHIIRPDSQTAPQYEYY